MLDCSIRIAIHLVDWIVIDNPKSKLLKFLFIKSKFHEAASSIKIEAIFIQNNVWLVSCDLIRRSPVGITCFTNKIKLSKFALIEYFFKFLVCFWIWIGLSICFEKWIWVWIDNHIFAMDLDWIDNPKKLDWAKACLFVTVCICNLFVWDREWEGMIVREIVIQCICICLKNILKEMHN